MRNTNRNLFPCFYRPYKAHIIGLFLIFYPLFPWQRLVYAGHQTGDFGFKYKNTISLFERPENILPNGSFELGLQYWSIEGGWGQLDQERSKEGEWSLRLTRGVARHEIIRGLVPGEEYILTTWIYLDPESGGDDWGGIQMAVFTEHWQQVSQQILPPNRLPTGIWTKQILYFRAPEDGAVRFQVGTFGGLGWDLNYWIDDLWIFRRMNNMAPQFTEIIWPEGGVAPWPVSIQVQAEDVDGIVEYLSVEFGDGSLYTKPSAEYVHLYGVPGKYEMVVTAIDDMGTMIRASHPIQILPPGDMPVIQILYPNPTTVDTLFSSSVKMEGKSSVPGSNILWINERNLQMGRIESDDEGHWQVQVHHLMLGENILAAQFHTAEGKVAIARVKVFFKDTTLQNSRVNLLELKNEPVGRFELWEMHMDIKSYASNPFLPYGYPKGDSTGLTVNGVFIKGKDTLVQPAFYDVKQELAENDLLVVGSWRWVLRMGFPEEGIWNSYLWIEDHWGKEMVPIGQVQVVKGKNKGYIRVSEEDNRYFIYSDGSPFFPIGFNTSADQPVSVLRDQLILWHTNSINYIRIWLSPISPFSDAWSSWATHHQMESIGYLPPSLLSSERSYGRGVLSWKISWPPVPGVQTPSAFRGFWSRVPVKPGEKYWIVARVKSENVQGLGGVVIKTGDWLGSEDVLETSGIKLSEHTLRGFTDWVYLTAVWEAGPEDLFAPLLYVTLENVEEGHAYIDQMTMHQMDDSGNMGPNILDTWNANAHLYMDPIECRNIDYLIKETHDKDIHFQLVILEKNDPLINSFGRFGLPDQLNGHFEHPMDSYMGSLFQAYYRYIQARWGWSTSLASIELVNESAPGAYFGLLEDLCAYFHQSNQIPKMTTTSFWSEWVPEFWFSSCSDFADVHAYLKTTGFLESWDIDGRTYDRKDFVEDPALAIRSYGEFFSQDPLRTKPVIIGETDIDQEGDQAPDPMLSLDISGYWLVDWLWGHLAAQGVTGLLWNPENILQNHLYPIFRNFSAFIKGISMSRQKKFDANSKRLNCRVWAFANDSADTLLLWAKHKELSWRKAVTSGIPEPIIDSIQLYLPRSGTYIAEVWNPLDGTGFPEESLMIETDSEGLLILPVENLLDHRAWRIFFHSSTRSKTTFLENHTIDIWPNPVGKALYLDKSKLPISAQISVIDMFGNRWKHFSASEIVSDYIVLGDLSPGMYLLEIIDSNFIAKQKFIYKP